MLTANTLFELSYRANINTRRIGEEKVVLYEDHRTLLNVLYYLKTETNLDTPANVILFDNHDDACKPTDIALDKISGFNKQLPSLRDFWSFTEFDLGHKDDDWVKAGMELGLIKNLFLFNATESHIDFVETYETMDYGTTRIYNLGNVWTSLLPGGCLYDLSRRNRFSQFWSDLGWVFDSEIKRFSFKPTTGFITDFDLDCFSTVVLDKRIAIPWEVLNDRFSSHLNQDRHPYYTACDFVRELIKNSEVTTICFENGYCGGYRQMFKIFEMVDNLFFDNLLADE